ncbi:hypothetical protein [Haloarcula onubensis]|nr:hypothetical protein [Halomicroarcula sp. S3CR25-11]
MTDYTTLSVEPDVARDVRELRDTDGHANTSDTLRQLLRADGE